jgi:hypothetical protein
LLWLVAMSATLKQFQTNSVLIMWCIWFTNIAFSCYCPVTTAQAESQPSGKHNILFLCVPCIRLPLWSSGQSSWLQIQRSAFDPWRYQIFWEEVVLEQGPLSLMSTIEELLERKSSSSGLEIRDYGCRDLSR